mmetsp:Transcript_50179/g.121580  ORF Transcript_50179/g.121580 Transcript_50179/m.121580 type:complete len:478 (+) Transcript_50179:523-1956(+)
MTTKVSSAFVSTHHRRQHLQRHFHSRHHRRRRHHHRPLVLQQRIEEDDAIDRIIIDELGVDRILESVTAPTATADQLSRSLEEKISEPSTNSTPIDEGTLVGGGSTFNYRGMNITIGVEELVLPRATRYLTFVFATILVLMSAVCLGFIYRYRQHVIVCVGQPFFLGLVCIGVTFSSIGLYLSAVVKAGIPSIDEGREDMACVAQSWFYGIGEITVYMALVCKLWRVFRLTRSFQRQKVLAKHAVAPLIIMAVASLAVLIAWTIVDPPTWEQQYFAMSMTESDAAAATFTIQTIGFCDTGGTFSYILIGLSTLSLLSALIMACRTRNIREDLTDSRRIFQTLLCHFLLLLVSVGGSIGSTFLESYALYYFSTDVTGFLSSFATLALLIVPKIYYVVYEKKTGTLPPRAKTGQEIQQIGPGQGQVHITGLSLPPNSVTERNDDRRSVVGEGATIRAPSPNKKEEVPSSGEERTIADSV